MARMPRLLTLSIVVDADDENDELDDAINRLIDAAESAFPLEHPQGVQMCWSTTLDERTENSGRCAECDAWVTDVERSDTVSGLGPGARVDGRLLCDEHLPEGHPHAF